MDIKKIATYSDQRLARVQEMDSRPIEQAKAASTKANSGAESSDRVAFSKGYQEIDRIKKVVMEMADIRMDRVEDVRKMIQQGTYKVDPDQVAGRILDEQW
ncbi:MAG TPA: flagellar biosynthesis anti-sigma factor FlgM [Syntrophobacteraceae bacterium]|nr:flagellar biosynthesis anti-sigma factor FlgM [Syntrophobacteraceae bacterium]